MTHSTVDVDPARPIPPAEQPARIAALAEAVRARTGIVPELGIVLGSGLGGLAAQRQQPALAMVTRTGTDNNPMPVNYEELDQPAAFRRRRDQTVDALRQSGMDALDIPAFLRRQAN